MLFMFYHDEKVHTRLHTCKHEYFVKFATAEGRSLLYTFSYKSVNIFLDTSLSFCFKIYPLTSALKASAHVHTHLLVLICLCDCHNTALAMCTYKLLVFFDTVS